MKTCNHPKRSEFIAYQAKGGATIWRCSHCGKEDVWRESWQYYGSLECKVCQVAAIWAVTCSEACREAFKHPNPLIQWEMASAR